jgi:hypothetical protein
MQTPNSSQSLLPAQPCMEILGSEAAAQGSTTTITSSSTSSSSSKTTQGLKAPVAALVALQQHH